jgi:hypothetical protein
LVADVGPDGVLVSADRVHEESPGPKCRPAQAIMVRNLSLPYQQYASALPTVEDGALGMAFIEAAILSNERENRWSSCPPIP